MQAFFARSQTQAAFSGIAAFDEPMSRHTTFNIGGPADLYLKPDSGCFVSYIIALLKLARAESVPVFILGGGANLLVADAGIRGVVLDTGSWTGTFVESEEPEGRAGTADSFHRSGATRKSGDAPLREKRNGPASSVETIPATTGNTRLAAVRARFRSGTPADDAVRWAAAKGLSGLEDFAGLPGTIGGAVWMNARCYERAVSDILVETAFLDERLELITAPADSAAFAYKKSPFQGRNSVILEAVFSLRPGDPALIVGKTVGRLREREAKGHFRYPSAGSIFKNNRAFGRPVGTIIEELGLRGLRSGGAQIAPWHGNFIINTGGATADDVKRLVTLMEEKALKTFGFTFEREVIYAG
jgi:UDP-N-acetylmuramate dehydrogenase